MTKKEINKEEGAGRKRWKISGKDEAFVPPLPWKRPRATAAMVVVCFLVADNRR